MCVLMCLSPCVCVRESVCLSVCLYTEHRLHEYSFVQIYLYNFEQCVQRPHIHTETVFHLWLFHFSPHIYICEWDNLAFISFRDLYMQYIMPHTKSHRELILYCSLFAGYYIRHGSHIAANKSTLAWIGLRMPWAGIGRLLHSKCLPGLSAKVCQTQKHAELNPLRAYCMAVCRWFECSNLSLC